MFLSLNLEDIEQMLDGNGTDISVRDWKVHIYCNRYEENDHQISWFCKVVIYHHVIYNFTV